MALLAGFLEVLLRALVLIGMALSVGGVAFVRAVLLPLKKRSQFHRTALKHSLLLIASGGLVLAVAQVILVLIEPWALADEFGRWPVAQFLSTGFARASMVHALIALGLAATALWFSSHLRARFVRTLIVAEGVLLMASGAWLVHAVSRLEHAAPLMAATVIHQLGAALWAGGVLHLAVLWRFTGSSAEKTRFWPYIVARFSPVAVLSISIIIAAGLYLSFRYIGTMQGLFGTAYGVMVLTKIALLGFALFLGTLNFLNVKQWKQKAADRGINERTPLFAESEAVTGIIILLSAAALTAQPPSIDIPSERASPSEVLQVFAPKVPQLLPPPHRQMVASALSSFDPFGTPGKLDRIQSDFNHNVAGFFVLLTGLLALLSRAASIRFARHWPLSFLLLALFLLLFGEPNGWPFGTEGFWETIIVPSVLEHRIATFFVIGLAIFEWNVQTGRLDRPGSTRLRFVFPVLCIAGGALLLTHSHSAFAIKREFLIETSHNAIGFLAVLMGNGRLLELRLPRPVNRWPGFLWIACLILIGLILFFYREV